MSEANIIERRKQYRSKEAARLRELRREYPKRWPELTPKLVMAMVKCFKAEVPKKPTRENILAEIDELLQYANEPIGQQGDEYYSQCGLEDAIGDSKDQCGMLAKELAHAIGMHVCWDCCSVLVNGTDNGLNCDCCMEEEYRRTQLGIVEQEIT